MQKLLRLVHGAKGPSTLPDRRYNEGFKAGAEDAREEVLGFLQRTGASAETLRDWLEKGEH